MRVLKAVVAGMALAVTGVGAAMDGQFDRTAEVEKYVQLATNGTRGDLVPASKEIYVSGLSDPRLSAALKDRLMRDYQGLKQQDRADQQYGAWLVKALASTGTDEAAETLKQVRKGVKIGSIRTECKDELELIEQHRRKNEIMASRANFSAGDDPRNAQLLNLLKSDDFAFKHMAADRISWEKRLNPKLMDEMAAQLVRYMDDTGTTAGRQQTKAMGMYAKLLGYSGDAKYREPLEQVMKSKAGMLVKKHAKEALERLQ